MGGLSGMMYTPERAASTYEDGDQVSFSFCLVNQLRRPPRNSKILFCFVLSLESGILSSLVSKVCALLQEALELRRKWRFTPAEPQK